MQNMQSAATEVEKATAQAAGGPSVPKQPATHVVIDQPTFKLGDFLWVGSKGAVGALGQAIMVLFLTFFLLVGGDTFKRKLVRLTGPSLSNKKITVQILDDINHSIQKYLFMLLLTNVLVGLLVWAAFSLDRARQCRGVGGRGRVAPCHPLPRSRRHGRRHRNGRIHAVRLVLDGACWSPARRWRSPRSSELSSRPG